MFLQLFQQLFNFSAIVSTIVQMFPQLFQQLFKCFCNCFNNCSNFAAFFQQLFKCFCNCFNNSSNFLQVIQQLFKRFWHCLTFPAKIWTTVVAVVTDAFPSQICQSQQFSIMVCKSTQIFVTWFHLQISSVGLTSLNRLHCFQQATNRIALSFWLQAASCSQFFGWFATECCWFALLGECWACMT